MIKRLSAVCIVLALCMGGCTKNTTTKVNKNSSNTVETKKEEQNVITYEYDSYKKDFKNSEGKVTAHWTASFPQFTFSSSKDTAEKINKSIKDKLGEIENLLGGENGYFNNKEYEEYMEGVGGNPSDGYCEITVKRYDDKVISVQFLKSTLMYQGRSVDTFKCMNFDSKTGNLISFNDLSENSTKLYEEAADYLDEMKSTKSYKEKIAEDRVVDIHDFVNEDKWYLSEGGLKLVSDVGELGSNSKGPIQFEIPYEKMTSIKKDYSYEGNYNLYSRTDYEVKTDIDNDGTDEDVLVTCDYDQDAKVEINDRETDGDAVDVLAGEYFIVDLDKNDNYKEIAIQKYEHSADYENDYGYAKDLNYFNGKTYFYRYKGNGKLEYCGYIDKLISDCRVDYTKEKLKKY